MAERLSMTKRIRMKNLAEEQIMLYADDHTLWHKHVHNVELDAMQILKCIEMDQHANTIDYSCRRTGKTAVKEMHDLKTLATKPDQSLGVVAPREAQAKVNLDYHLDAIRRSEILSSYVDYKSGRRQIADTYFQLANRSKARCYGIMANVDGGDLTLASLEEVDDMPRDRLYNRFLLMLGATRQLGAVKSSQAEPPQIRVTGVFKGADTLQELIASGKYHGLPIVDVNLGIEMGIIHKTFMEDMRDQLSSEEYIRQLLCKNVTSRNLIWEKWIRVAMVTGLMASIELAGPLPGVQYKKRGLISFGYDHSGHGESPEASKYALVVWEQIGQFSCPIFCRTWPPGTDEPIVERDIVGYWEYFRPDYAMGDAFGIGLITHVNDRIYSKGLTTINRHTVNDGDSTASSWAEWPFSPLRFEGMTKHAMATALKSVIHNRQAAIPYIEDNESDDDFGTSDLRLFIRQLANIKTEQNKAGYSTYKMVNAKIGDDLFDAGMAGLWALITQGLTDIKTVILSSGTTREKLTGAAAALPGQIA
jgi:hypothetical protein